MKFDVAFECHLKNFRATCWNVNLVERAQKYTTSKTSTENKKKIEISHKS